MADRSQFDQNNRPTLIVVSNDGLRTPVELWADPTTHALITSGSGGGGGGTQYADGAARGTATGTLGMVDDGVNIQSMAGDTAGNTFIVGNVAGAATDSGNPIKVGGKINTTQPIYTDGQRGDMQLDTRGNLRISIVSSNGTTAAGVQTPADGQSLGAAVRTQNINGVYNGATVDLGRAIINATNSTGTGITAAGILAQFDDVSPTAITENQFGNIRMSANRNLYGTIRDAAGNERGVNVTANSSLQVVQQSSTSTPTNVASSATSVTLLAANTARIGGSIFNDSTQVLYIKKGATASNTSYDLQVAAGGYYEINGGYNGRIDGIWASANGNARISELT